MSPNVFVHCPKWGGARFQVWFVVGVQFFKVNEPTDSGEHADFCARMLARALGNFKGEVAAQ